VTVLLCVLMWGGVALAETPNPDRPSVSRTAHLVAPDTLELELGYLWANGNAVPALLKYSIAGVVEPRIGANLGGVGAGTPGLEGGLKVRLIEEGKWGLAAYGASAIPVSADEAWTGNLHGLFTTGLGGSLSLQLNAGLDLAGTGDGIGLAGFPIVAAVGLAPTRKLSLFVESAGKVAIPGCDDLQCAYGNVIFDGGVGFLLTEILVVDGGFGWDLLNDQPFAQVGITANVGSVR
jgi:hypothetical protein